MPLDRTRHRLFVGLVAMALVASCSSAGSPPSDPTEAASSREPVVEDRFTVRYPAGEGDGPLPTVVLIHGGAFTSGDRDQAQLEIVGSALRSRGYATASVDYRIDPTIDDRLEEYFEQTGAPYSCDPAQEATGQEDPGDIGGPGRPCLLYLRVIERGHADVLAALRDLRAAGPGLGLEVDEVALYGESAGGTLAVEVALDDGGTDQVVAVVGVASGSAVPADAHVSIDVLLVTYEDAEVQIDNLDGADQVAILASNVEDLRAAGAEASLLLLPGSEHLPAAGSAELDLLVDRSVELFTEAGVAPT